MYGLGTATTSPVTTRAQSYQAKLAPCFQPRLHQAQLLPLHPQLLEECPYLASCVSVSWAAFIISGFALSWAAKSVLLPAFFPPWLQAWPRCDTRNKGAA